MRFHVRMTEARVHWWLWAARLFRTLWGRDRGGPPGRGHVNGVRVKPAKAVRPGDRLEVTVAGARRELVVLEVAEERGPAAVAATLYEETPASIARREELALERRQARPPGADLGARPTKRDRRRLERAASERSSGGGSRLGEPGDALRRGLGEDHGGVELLPDLGRNVCAEEACEEPVMVLAEDDRLRLRVARGVDDRPPGSPAAHMKSAWRPAASTWSRASPSSPTSSGGGAIGWPSQSAMSSSVPKNRSTCGSSGISKTESTTSRAFRSQRLRDAAVERTAGRRPSRRSRRGSSARPQLTHGRDADPPCCARR